MMKFQNSQPLIPVTPTRIIPLHEVEKRVGRSRWWIRSEVNAGRFPRPVELGGRRVAFVEAEVEGWLTNLIAKRDGARGR